MPHALRRALCMRPNHYMYQSRCRSDSQSSVPTARPWNKGVTLGWGQLRGVFHIPACGDPRPWNRFGTQILFSHRAWGPLGRPWNKGKLYNAAVHYLSKRGAPPAPAPAPSPQHPAPASTAPAPAPAPAPSRAIVNRTGTRTSNAAARAITDH